MQVMGLSWRTRLKPLCVEEDERSKHSVHGRVDTSPLLKSGRRPAAMPNWRQAKKWRNHDLERYQTRPKSFFYIKKIHTYAVTSFAKQWAPQTSQVTVGLGLVSRRGSVIGCAHAVSSSLLPRRTYIFNSRQFGAVPPPSDYCTVPTISSCHASQTPLKRRDFKDVTCPKLFWRVGQNKLKFPTGN